MVLNAVIGKQRACRSVSPWCSCPRLLLLRIPLQHELALLGELGLDGLVELLLHAERRLGELIRVQKATAPILM